MISVTCPLIFVPRTVESSRECKENCSYNHLSTYHCNFSFSLSMQDGNNYLGNVSLLQITTGRAMHCSVFWDQAQSSIPNSHYFPLTCTRENHRLLYRMVQKSDKRLVLRYEQPVLITTNTRIKTINRNYLFFFIFFSRRSNPWWVLACFTILFHNLLSLHLSLQFLTFIFFKSSSTWSSHLSLGLPTGLNEHGSHSVSFLTVLVVSIRITCATQRNLCDFINLTIFFFLN